MDVLDFALGEPDFKTPENIQDAAIRAMRAGQTHYTPPAGIPELRQALADHYSKESRPADPGRPGSGLQRRQALDPQRPDGRHGPGDEVIIPAPYWVSYADLVKLTGAVPVDRSRRPKNPDSS